MLATTLLAAAVLFLCGADGSYFTGVQTRYIQENYDGVHNIWYITAYCYIRYTYAYTCYYAAYYSCGWYGWDSCLYYVAYTCYAHAYADVVCNECYVNSDPSSNFVVVSSRYLQKKWCPAHTCAGDCPATDGCLRGGDTHTVGVTCYNNQYETVPYISTSFDVVVNSANGPTFYYSNGASISISHDNVGAGSVINTIVPSLADDGYDWDYVRYRQARGPGVSYLHQTPDLFALDTSNGQVKVMKSLALEFDYYFDMNLCVYDRRGRESCNVLYITLWACYQTPNCTNQEEWSLHDTFGTYTGHGGSSNVVFNPIYPQPNGHFLNFNPTWHKLTWTFDNNEFPEATMDTDTGVIYITRNISIWPSWPTKDYRARVRVANSESCYTTTCDFFVRVHYTNWPIEIRSLPNVPQYEQFEDDDNGYQLHDLIVFDYNNHTEDNMTCKIHTIQPHEDNLFELRHDGNYDWNSYTLYKLACQKPNCGYKHPLPSDFTHAAWQRFYCDTDIGCLTHNRTQQYVVTIKCDDAYNTTDQKAYTFNVISNKAPRYRTLPTHIDLDRNQVSQYDTIFEIMYWDLENENLIYEYQYNDTEAPYADPDYFIGTTWGNYSANLGNITMTTYLWDKPVNKTYSIEICGHERRNEICEDLTVDIEEYCSEAPSCRSASTTVDMTLAVGSQLFDMSALVNPPTLGLPFSGLTYSIKAQQGNLFDIDSTTGIISLKASFPESYPSADYSIVAYVYNLGACNKGTCQLGVHVNFVNYPIRITNSPTTKQIHEDTTTVQTLFTVLTSDQNEDDSYTCNISNTASVGPFYLEREPPKTGYYYVKNRKDYKISATPSQYNINITCYDLHGSSASYVLVIQIDPNLAPQFTAPFTTAGVAKNGNISDFKSGDIIYTVSATDKEGDTIQWSCEINTNMNPLACRKSSTSVDVYLRRNLTFDHDNNQSQYVKICIGDAKHSNSSCGNVTVTFTQVKTAPSISNMNVWPLSFPENTAVGTILFTPTIDNPDAHETVTLYTGIYPQKYSSYFRVDKDTKKLILQKQLDYEVIKEIRFEFAVKDDYLMGLQNYTVFLYVTNINEMNTLTIKNHAISFPETTAVGSTLPELGLNCTDIDGDNVTMTILSGYNKDYFSLDSTTGKLTLTKVWDLETNILESTTLMLQCADPGGLTSTAAVDIRVTDVNEYEPYCSIIYKESDPLAITPATKLSTTLMTIQCSDLDRDDKGDFKSEALGKGAASKYFRAVQRSSRKRATGSSYTDIKLKQTIDYNNDKSFEVSFEISDGGGSALFTGITIVVNFTAGDPDEKSKETKKCLTCTTNGQAIIAVLAVELAAIVLFVVHACCSMVYHKKQVLRLADFDKIKHTRFDRGTQIKKIPQTFDNATSSPKNAASVVSVPKANASRSENRKQEVRSRQEVSSGSSSSDDSDIEEIKEETPGRNGFESHMNIPRSAGLPPPIYTSRPSSERSGAVWSPLGRFAASTQQPSGLPPPIYSSWTSSQASGKPTK